MEKYNYIVSTYLTSKVDEQRGTKKEIDDPDYIRKWVYSGLHLGLNMVVLHDGLSEVFISQFPKVRFIKIDQVPEGMQLYDYRWVLYYEFLLNNDCDAVFFTDISDVIIRRDPFYEMEDALYCGDEPTTIKDCEWLQTSRKSLGKLPIYNDFLHSKYTMLNCGIFGGDSARVKVFLDLMVRYIEIHINREVDGTVDMPLFNYIIWFYDIPIIHGAPVNSVFKRYEDRNDVWFIHK